MKKDLYIPQEYKPLIDLKETEKAIKLIKDFFQENLAKALKLRRVTAPLFVLRGTGINDDLNGIERPVSFPIKDMNESVAEVVQSLAKWKRMILSDYQIETGYGIYTDMNAIRPDETLDNIHSLYVDQWDWEKIVKKEERTVGYLKNIVNSIYSVLKKTEQHIYAAYPEIIPELPNKITFVHAEELEEMYPDLSSKQREDEITKKHGAVFVIGIGHPLKSGEPHDGRAPDYDDWISDNEDGYHGLNGDILLWDKVLNRSLEISSMGIRVDKEALEAQLKMTGTEKRKNLMFHQRLLNDELPLSIGGGIGQSRLCMFFLKKAHIGEIQATIWPDDMIEECKKHNIHLM